MTKTKKKLLLEVKLFCYRTKCVRTSPRLLPLTGASSSVAEWPPWELIINKNRQRRNYGEGTDYKHGGFVRNIQVSVRVKPPLADLAL